MSASFDEISYIVDRLRNTTGSAEGSSLPPRQSGDGRVPTVKGLQVLQSRNVGTETEFTLGWTEPDTAATISRYAIHVTYSNTLGDKALPAQHAPKSPAVVRVPFSGSNVTVTFRVQTILTSGMTSLLENSPTTSSATKSGATKGTVALVAGSATVTTIAVRDTSLIFLTAQNFNFAAGEVYVSSRTSGNSFTITSTDGGDLRTIAWMIVEP